MGMSLDMNAMASAIIEKNQFDCRYKTIQYDTTHVLRGVVSYTLDRNSLRNAPSRSPKLLSPQLVSPQASPNTKSTLTKVCSYQTLAALAPRTGRYAAL
jgi:hypothetical protein